MNNTVKILGCGLAKAQQKITNYDLEKRVETSHEWIVQRTGITSRYVTIDENTSDLALRAAVQAIENAKITQDRCTNKDTDCLIMSMLYCLCN